MKSILPHGFHDQGYIQRLLHNFSWNAELAIPTCSSYQLRTCLHCCNELECAIIYIYIQCETFTCSMNIHVTGNNTILNVFKSIGIIIATRFRELGINEHLFKPQSCHNPFSVGEAL